MKNLKFLSECAKFKNEGKIDSWSFNGSIFAKKNENDELEESDSEGNTNNKNNISDNNDV